MSNRQKYSPEFRTEAVKLVLEQGLNRDDAAKRLAMPKGTLVRWIAEVRNNKASPLGSRSISELASENNQLIKELKQVKIERDILKKAAAYFAKESLQSTRS